MNSVVLGVGLLSIGRTWGAQQTPPPSEEQAINLIQQAYANGLRFFDTAPAYAKSETILGSALSQTSLGGDLYIATKMGEYWDDEKNRSYASHAYVDLMTGLERSIKILGRIDLLQLHKANRENIISPAVVHAIDFAKTIGITQFGASVSDLETAFIACSCGLYNYIQFPYNIENRQMEAAFYFAKEFNTEIIVNRPFAMGGLLQKNSNSDSLFSFILEQDFSGVILTGTSSSAHLIDNINSFEQAKKKCG